MVFSSSEFIFGFLPIVLIGYYLLGKLFSSKVQKCFLVVASLYFYAYFKITYLYIIVCSIVLNYIVTKIMQQGKCDRYKRVVFVGGVLFNVLLLGYFKYFDFLIENINLVFKTDFSVFNILLPLGISFFTFQQLSFLVSIKRGEEEVSGFLDYCLFVTFFPQLVAGPIVTYDEMISQFKDDRRMKFCSDAVAMGIYFFVIGLFKKLVIADSLALFVDNGFNNLETYGFLGAWITSLSYTLQIYFDFSGYSDMAIGLGKMFNINLPINFNSPYKSASIKEFWGRWHMTLGRALANFVYYPLGGNRKGKLKTYRNLFITFFVSGLWHGASWTFIVWGVCHGTLNIIERVFKDFFDKIPHKLRVLGTFLFVNAAWVLFRAPSFEKAMAIFRGMINITNINIYEVSIICYDGIFSFPAILYMAMIVMVLICLLVLVFKFKNSYEYMENIVLDNKNLVFCTALFVICIIHLSRVSTFIYFNF
ncbi:MBOAT family O-acyltransferase [Intestinibacter sp.]